MTDESTIINDGKDRDEKTQYGEATMPLGGGKKQNKTEQKPRRSATWTTVAGGAGVGLLIGAAATFLITTSASAATGEEEVENDDDEGGEGNQTDNSLNSVVDSGVAVATGVNDNMTFGEAFAAARAEVGAGGVFEWHGNLYGTYYAEEWDNMTPEERQAYNDHFNWNNLSSTDNTTAQQVEVEAEVDNNVNEASLLADNQPIVEPEPIADVEAEVEVELLGVAHDAEANVDVAAYMVNDQAVAFVDMGSDGTVDVIAVDLNGDGAFSPDEMADVSGEGIHMSDLPGTEALGYDDAGSGYLASNNMPDYVNDADVDGFA